MPLPEGHWRERHAPREIGRRERLLIGVAVAAIVALAAGFAFSLGSPVPRSGRGCIALTYQAATGGTELRRCGDEARSLCAQAGDAARPPSPPLLAALRQECPRAGLPVHP